ncbi:MAG: ribonuclease HII [Oscillospiraceae bacterium]|nr:ribonuclease HII [Oscillospiraceae bacterium]
MNLYKVENDLRREGLRLVCGVDEAGRGPLAGPVCAAAVILPEGTEIPGLNDSKKLTEKKREALFPVIKSTALHWGIAFADHKEIDELNILQATFLAMKRAVEMLGVEPELGLIDGNRCPEVGFPVKAVVGGDAKCACIAAASVLAKVSRDRFMLEMDGKYPGYGFAQHKGYPTAAHYAALRELGPCPIHRLTFLKKMH